MENAKRHVYVVIGPTASGKSDFAVELAHKLNGEIISADSRQVYKGLDIGTGKITTEEMQGIPHHMLNVYNVGDDVGVVRYKDDALPILEDILARDKTPIICGGTGQYVDALIDDVSIPQVSPDHTLRASLEQKSTEELFELLEKQDSRRAEKIDKHNRVRLIRALEIIASLGSVPAQDTPARRYNTTIYLMKPTRILLKERIIRRLLKRLDEGMVQEIQHLLKEDKITHDQCFKLGLEYRYISLFLQEKISYEEMIEKLSTQIWRYAKRQMTWNKKYEPEAIQISIP